MEFNEEFYTSVLSKNCFVTKRNAEEFIQKLYDTLFQIGDKQITSKVVLNNEFEILASKMKIILSCLLNDELKIEQFIKVFFSQIPSIYKELLNDAMFIVENDPASNSEREVQIAYPGFFATAIYRFAHIFESYKIPFIPRVLSEYAHSKTGIDIHPGAVIGSPFMIDHGTGIVIGETTEIGKGVKIFQGVTLGAMSVSRDKRSVKRHPTIEDNVVIYSGATILGGNTVVGKNSVIGGNVWLTESVDAEARVFHKSQIIVKGKKVKKEPINFVI